MLSGRRRSRLSAHNGWDAPGGGPIDRGVVSCWPRLKVLRWPRLKHLVVVAVMMMATVRGLLRDGGARKTDGQSDGGDKAFHHGSISSCRKTLTPSAWVNSWFLRDLRAAFGGAKQSGTGREGGPHSLEFYTEHPCVCVEL